MEGLPVCRGRGGAKNNVGTGNCSTRARHTGGGACGRQIVNNLRNWPVTNSNVQSDKHFVQGTPEEKGDFRPGQDEEMLSQGKAGVCKLTKKEDSYLIEEV